MSESTLSLKITDLQAKLGSYSGWGRGALFGETAWTSYQQAIIDDACQSGLRRFYYPEPLQGQVESHCWTFLRPTATLTLQTGNSTLNLPDDFGGFEGELTVQLSSGVIWMPVKLYNPGEIDAKYSLFPTMTSKPCMAAIQWLKETTLVSGQRAQLYVWPKADQAYPLRFQYYILPNYLDAATAPYALGGASHIETVLESCLAIMEERLDDIPRGQGIHGMAFASRLAASISMDRRNKAQDLGPNLDRSDWMGTGGLWNHYNDSITYKGASL